jgi:hypothetical protein
MRETGQKATKRDILGHRQQYYPIRPDIAPESRV